MGIERQFLKFFEKFFFAHRLIKNVEFFLLKAVAKKAVTYAAAISQERAVSAPLAIVGKKQAVSAFRIYAFVAEFGIENIRAIHAIAAVVREPHIHAIFVVFGIEHKIAIFAVARVINIG